MVTFPPANYERAPSAVAGIEVYRPIPEPEGEAEGRDIVEFKCPRCQATRAYSAADGGLRCAHCGYYEPPAAPVVGKGAEEFEFKVSTLAAAAQAQGWGVQRRTLRCQNCGAETSLPTGQLTHTCPFCGSNRVLQQEAPQESLRPRFLIPFQVPPEQCTRISREWLGSSWMTPKALKMGACVDNFTAIYLPYWTFDARTAAQWRAQVGHTVTERHYNASTKSWETRTKTVWRWESGRAALTFDDLLVTGSARLSTLLLQKLGDFDLRALVPYQPEYLAGLMAHAYDVQLEEAWATARERMRKETRLACREQASTSKIRNFSMMLDFSDESWRYVLLPVYVSVYRYAGESYHMMMNGQTGTIAGQRPVDWAKVWLAIGGMLAPSILVGLLGLLAGAGGLIFPPAMGGGLFLLIVAFIFFVVGMIFAVMTYMKARGMDDA